MPSPLRCIAALLLLLTLPAQAAPLTEADLIRSLQSEGQAAQDAARWLGEAESVAGLRAVVASGKQTLVDWYVRGFPDQYGPAPEFPFLDEHIGADIERQLVALLGDARLGPALKDEALNLLQHRRYRGRPLFDQMLRLASSEDWRLRRGCIATLGRSSQAGIEAPVLELAARLGDDDFDLLLPFFQERRLAAALPLLKLHAARRHAAGRGVGSEFYATLSAIGTAEAATLLLDQLDRLRSATPGPGTQSMLRMLLANLARLPPELPLPLTRLIGRVPQLEDPGVAEDYVQLLAARRDPGTIDALLELAEQPNRWWKVEPALRALDTPAAWQQLRTRLEPRIAAASARQRDYQRLDEEMRRRLDDPPAYHARQDQQRRVTEARRRQEAPAEQYRRQLEILKRRDPALHARAMKIYEELQEKAIVEQAALAPAAVEELAAQKKRRAAALRFVEQRPQDAVRTMRRALELEQGIETLRNPADLVWLADIHRHELKNPEKAVEYYRAALDWAQRQEPSFVIEAQLVQGLRYWLPHEIRYLQTGHRYSGAIGDDEAAAVATVLLLFMRPMNWGGGEDYWPADAKTQQRQQAARRQGLSGIRLDEAPQSQLMLIDARYFLAAEPDPLAILAFMERQDPAHFLSAAMLAHYESRSRDPLLGDRREFTEVLRQSARKDPSPTSLSTAAALFRQRHGIRFVAYSDPSMATPQSTWRLLLSALRAEDLDTAASCFTDAAAGELRRLLAGVPPQRWGLYAMSLLSITPATAGSEPARHVVSRELPGSGPSQVDRSLQAGFVREGNRWKLADVEFLRPLREGAGDPVKKTARAADPQP